MVTDGAWATEVQKRGLALGTPGDLWNLERPADVEAVARSYVDAGSVVILTNTFRANEVALQAVGAATRGDAINRRGVALSRAAADGKAACFRLDRADRNPSRTGGRGPGVSSPGRNIGGFRRGCAGVGDVRCARRSTPGHPRGACVEIADCGVVLLFPRNRPRPHPRSRHSRRGRPAHHRRRRGRRGGELRHRTGRLRVDLPTPGAAAPELPVWIKPNAGLPKIRKMSAQYDMTPETFASYVFDLRNAGASFLGGCCGAGPDFVRCLCAEAVRTHASADTGSG